MSKMYHFAEISYTADNIIPMVQYLAQHVDELHEYQTVTLERILTEMRAGDYRAAPEAFELMCRIIVDVRKMCGDPVRELATGDELN